MNSHPIPYLMMNDTWIGLISILCFITTCFIMTKGKRHFFQLVKELFNSRSSQSYTITQTTSEDFRFYFLFEVQACLFIAILFFSYTSLNGQMNLKNEYQSLVYLGVFTVILFIGTLLKIIIYRLIGWVFFDKSVINSCIKYYFVTDILTGLVFFPLLLLIVYANIPSDIYLPITLILFILIKLLLIFKALTLFFLNPYTKIYFIAYLCALELILLVLIIKGLFEANDFLQLNY